MANEKHSNLNLKQELKKVEVKKELNKSCMKVAQVAFDSMIENGGSYADAAIVSSATLLACNLYTY